MTTVSVQRMQIERVILQSKTMLAGRDIPMAEFYCEHRRLCMAYLVAGKPFIQVAGGQMTMEQAGVLQAAVDLAKEWLLEIGATKGIV